MQDIESIALKLRCAMEALESLLADSENEVTDVVAWMIDRLREHVKELGAAVESGVKA